MNVRMLDNTFSVGAHHELCEMTDNSRVDGVSVHVRVYCHRHPCSAVLFGFSFPFHCIQCTPYIYKLQTSLSMPVFCSLVFSILFGELDIYIYIYTCYIDSIKYIKYVVMFCINKCIGLLEVGSWKLKEDDDDHNGVSLAVK